MVLSPVFVRLTSGKQDLNGLLLFILINNVWILCFVNRTSRYNRVKKPNLMHNLFLVYFVNLYMFRAYLGPSSGGTTVCIQHLVLIILLRWQNKLYIKLGFLYTNDVWVWGVFFSLYQLVRDSKVLIGGSCSRIKALHDRLDCLITVKDNLSFIQC
jgi:hypothetical protein